MSWIVGKAYTYYSGVNFETIRIAMLMDLSSGTHMVLWIETKLIYFVNSSLIITRLFISTVLRKNPTLYLSLHIILIQLLAEYCEYSYLLQLTFFRYGSRGGPL
ncbi:Os11g0688200 [Oryza sativa Japonica Group]|uniref:Expressed protein n=1 Tax=Oryza sativa subsp. japonica TaxID=39947 RepID=Q2QZG0_ORYSJ|nr:expressed protein [Oryza sativa Japonica Group]BAT15293.1 Os11g0688200 [Oryza sativa Japonica Group]